ncbi:MAG: YHS domain-containing (seleno)protein [Myxococcota bacterium]
MMAFFFGLWIQTSAAAEPVPPVNADKNHIAVEGVDVVAYFEQGAVTPGSAEHTVEYQGATWRFSTAAHQNAFAADPSRYAPQFGGYCAWAVAHGYTASIDPQAWRIVDDKLYLNYSVNIQRKWERDRSAQIAAAEANWPTLIAPQVD